MVIVQSATSPARGQPQAWDPLRNSRDTRRVATGPVMGATVDQSLSKTSPAVLGGSLLEEESTLACGLTLNVTNFLLGRVSMDDVAQYCVLDALALLQPAHMSIYVIGSDSLMRIVGSFGRGTGHDALHRYSCLEDAHVGGQLGSGRALATFALPDMRPSQQLDIPELGSDPQVLWPLGTSHRLLGAIHMSFTSTPDARAVATALAAVAAPISLALDLQGRDALTAAPAAPRSKGPQDGQLASTLRHPSLMGPVQRTSTRPLALVTSPADQPPAREQRSSDPRLTPRQLRVLSLMAQGMTNGQIARVLAFSESTVRQDTMAIYRILHVKGRSEAVHYGRTHGLIAP